MLLCGVLTAHAANKTFTLVIDAGHGGNDYGAPGKVTNEKTLTLRMALAFGQMVERNCPDVKVVYTRKTDKFVELYRRAEIANNNKADLFISIHINALPRGRVARGFQTYTLGRSKRTGQKTGVMENLEVAKRENAVILMEKDYKQTYQGYDPNSPESDIMFEFIQDKNMANSVELAKYMQKYVCQATGRQNMGAQQDNLAVLRLTSMPGCLIELGFISTRDEEQYMNSKQATEQYARGIFNAFQAYRKRHGGNIVIPYQADTTKDEVDIPQIVPDSEKKASKNNQRTAKKQPAAEPKKVEEKAVEEKQPEPQAAEQAAEQKADSTVVQQPAAEPEPEAKNQPEANATTQPEPPVFKVQFLASSGKLKAGDARFKGLTGVDSYQEGGMYKYTVGASTDYNEIYRKRKSIVDKFPQAFIIAFRNGARMDVNEAIREFKSKKAKK